MTDEDGGRDYLGILAFPGEKAPEKNTKAKERMIVYDDVRGKMAGIFDDIKNKYLSLQHICPDYDAIRTYPLSRMIMIFASFERLYGHIYGKDANRSEEYLEMKEKVVKLIDQLVDSSTGKRKKYAKTLRNYVDSRDASFAANTAYALRDCSEIMRPFLKKYYKGEFEETVEEISERIGIIRNGIAHCRLDFKLEAIHLSDIHIIEELIYAMEVKQTGLDSRTCERAIGRLFGENMSCFFGKNGM